ncbi:hypothetical protein GOODEAATRI_028335 [Goodea atripinnis]|uniref:Uncharacterized protein n=1 Tax=Goodea atripinnis TaxID=208336 RepID=A0ABV0MLH6_9TELE
MHFHGLAVLMVAGCYTSLQESCNPDHMPPLSTESQTKMTAECPVCRGVFDIDTIETHASDCGICSSDKEGNLRKGLRLYGLLEVMETHPGLCLPLFVPREDDRVGIHFLCCLN